tara:strand:- start:14584 stop:14838 length:255 start_codon:yes stop_codon:yes gene_type:complete
MSQPNAGLGWMPGALLHIFQMQISEALLVQCHSMMSVMEGLHDTEDVKELESVENLLKAFAEDLDHYHQLVEGKLDTAPSLTPA